jgi:hypothetical protein
MQFSGTFFCNEGSNEGAVKPYTFKQSGRSMRSQLFNTVLFSAIFLPFIGSAQELPPASATEDWTVKPPIVAPAEDAHLPPSDAIVLYNGKQDLGKWEHLDKSHVKWQVDGEALTIVPKTTDIQTKAKFGSAQVHIEWKTPDPTEDKGMNRGNSGVFLMGLYELQIYESYNDDTRIYYNGQAGSVYKQHIPLVNAARKPQTWQSFDIIFEAPVFNADKSLKSPAYMTVLHNNVLILNHVELKGPMVYQGFPKYEYHEAKMPLRLQEHGSRVSFRNIWIREL